LKGIASMNAVEIEEATRPPYPSQARFV